jgi:hypothetical protein
VIDVANDLYQSFHGGNVTVQTERRITGGGKFMASFAPDDAYFTAYFCADFNTKFTKYDLFDSHGIIDDADHASAKSRRDHVSIE